MLWNSFHSYRIKSFAYVVISKWGRYWLKCTWHNNQLFYFLLPYTSSSVAPPDLPHFTLESSQMLFNHIHYKQALFFSFNRKKDQRFVMNPYWWYYVAFQVYYLIYAVALSTPREILSFFVTEFDQIRDSYVYTVMRCGYFIVHQLCPPFCTWCGRFWLYYVFFFCYYVRWYIIK